MKIVATLVVLMAVGALAGYNLPTPAPTTTTSAPTTTTTTTTSTTTTSTTTSTPTTDELQEECAVWQEGVTFGHARECDCDVPCHGNCCPTTGICPTSSCIANDLGNTNLNCGPNGSANCPVRNLGFAYDAICDISAYNSDCGAKPAPGKQHCLGQVRCRGDACPEYEGMDCFHDGTSKNWKLCGCAEEEEEETTTTTTTEAPAEQAPPTGGVDTDPSAWESNQEQAGPMAGPTQIDRTNTVAEEGDDVTDVLAPGQTLTDAASVEDRASNGNDEAIEAAGAGVVQPACSVAVAVLSAAYFLQ